MSRNRLGPRATERDLERLIRESRLLDAPAKRHWLRVLRYLSVADRERLEAILRSESEGFQSGT